MWLHANCQDLLATEYECKYAWEKHILYKCIIPGNIPWEMGYSVVYAEIFQVMTLLVHKS